MAIDLTSLIQRIHASPTMAVLVLTGGGTQALADLLAVPGASKTLLEARIPYSEQALTELLGRPAAQAVCIETAATLARIAYQRAVALREGEQSKVFGLSCTAALVTDRPKRGAHRIHIGVSGQAGTCIYSLALQKGDRDRPGEERVASDLLLKALAEACAIEASFEMDLLPREVIEIEAIAP